MKNRVTVLITGYPQTPFSASLKDNLQRICLLRTAEKIGDIETINMTQLGRLKNSGIEYNIIG